MDVLRGERRLDIEGAEVVCNRAVLAIEPVAAAVLIVFATGELQSTAHTEAQIGLLRATELTEETARDPIRNTRPADRELVLE